MRIRSTKPEFWSSKTIASVDWDARLVLKGLESYVDDNGGGRDDIALIVSEVFVRDHFARPRETVARVSEAISRLTEAGLLWRYEASDTELLYISNWDSLQRIDKPNKGRFPRPDGTMNYRESTIRESVARVPETVAPGTEEQGNRGTGEQGITTSPEPPVPARDTPEPTKPTRNASPPAFDAWWRTYPKHKNSSKKAAHAEWQRATKLIDPERLLALTAAYAANPGVSAVDYCPDAHRWLKGRRWETVTETDHTVTDRDQGHGYTAQEWLPEPPPEAPWDYVDGEVLDTKELT